MLRNLKRTEIMIEGILKKIFFLLHGFFNFFFGGIKCDAE